MSEQEDEPSRVWPILKFEADEYMHHLDDAELTDEEKVKFLEGLWNLIVEFMSLEFDDHPAEHARAARKAKAAGRPNAGGSSKRR